MLDFTTKVGERAAARLKNEQIIWMTTTSSTGTPVPNPVWFVWDGETFLIYSQAKALRLKHIASRPAVSLHFNSDSNGDDIIVFYGQAALDPSVPPAHEQREYIAKYRDGIHALGMMPEMYGRQYSVAFRVTPTKLRGLNIGGIEVHDQY